MKATILVIFFLLVAVTVFALPGFYKTDRKIDTLKHFLHIPDALNTSNALIIIAAIFVILVICLIPAVLQLLLFLIIT